MATVNFSVPEAIKQAFNETFQGRNKSAIIAELMREAIERAQRRQRHVEAIDRILERRQHAPCLTEDEFRSLRDDGRS
ncbi:MAG: hypothetical protein IT487_12710 [Chromatiaceae bacterium]|nr:hypothetical protein [Chromatiaceae bacterium]